MRASHGYNWIAMSINFNVLWLFDSYLLDSGVHKSFKLQHFFSKGPAVHSNRPFASTRDHESLNGTDQQGSDVTIYNWELSDEILTLILIQHHVFLCSAAYEQI